MKILLVYFCKHYRSNLRYKDMMKRYSEYQNIYHKKPIPLNCHPMYHANAPKPNPTFFVVFFTLHCIFFPLDCRKKIVNLCNSFLQFEYNENNTGV